MMQWDPNTFAGAMTGVLVAEVFKALRSYFDRSAKTVKSTSSKTGKPPGRSRHPRR